jgi:hypothetical protein
MDSKYNYKLLEEQITIVQEKSDLEKYSELIILFENLLGYDMCHAIDARKLIMNKAGK